jgi:hypothetical protein
MKLSRRVIAVALCCGFALVSALAWWSKQEHRPSGALEAVSRYIALAAPVTSPHLPVASFEGSEPLIMSVPAGRLAGCKRPSTFHPFQTNGNRIRRLLNGRSPENDAVSVEFSDCLVRFYLRRQPNGQWQVWRVHSHAG